MANKPTEYMLQVTIAVNDSATYDMPFSKMGTDYLKVRNDIKSLFEQGMGILYGSVMVKAPVVRACLRYRKPERRDGGEFKSVVLTHLNYKDFNIIATNGKRKATRRRRRKTAAKAVTKAKATK